MVYSRALLYSFMLPLFAFLSGYVLGRPGGFRPRDYFWKRTLGLLVPYLVWETLYGPTKHPEMLRSIQEFAAYYVHIFVDPHFEGRMWYLYVLWLALMLLGLARFRVIVRGRSSPASRGSGGWVRTGSSTRLQWIYACIAAGVLYRTVRAVHTPSVARVGPCGGGRVRSRLAAV